jgi:hypothetical protein
MGIWGAVGKVEGKVIAGVDRGDHEWLSQSRLAALKASALILDGEVCVFDKQLVSQFHLLGGPEPEESCTSPVFMAFDCLHVHGLDVRGLPPRRRRHASWPPPSLVWHRRVGTRPRNANRARRPSVTISYRSA